MTDHEIQCNGIVPKMLEKFGSTATICNGVMGYTNIEVKRTDGQTMIVGIGKTPNGAWANALRETRKKRNAALAAKIVRP